MTPVILTLVVWITLELRVDDYAVIRCAELNYYPATLVVDCVSSDDIFRSGFE